MVAHCQDPLCASVITTIVDGLTAPADVGDYSSIAIGVDGLPVIAYHDRRSDDLRVAHCKDLGCTNATITVVDSGEGRGIFTDIAIGSDGFPVIVYNANAFSGGGLRVAHCTNVACTSSTNIRVDALGSYNMSVAIDSDGFPLISRRSIFNDEVSVIDCADVACNSSVKTEVGFSAAPICCGGYTSIAVDPSGRAFVIYSEDLFAELRFAVRS